MSEPTRQLVTAVLLLIAVTCGLSLRRTAIDGASPGATERVTVDSTGAQGNGDSDAPPSISANGRYVAMDSIASNLVAGDTNGYQDVFVRDRQTGTTERVSLDSAGAEGNGRSKSPSISSDGRYVAFISGATNLVPGDTNDFEDAFVRDRITGITERVAVDTVGTQANYHSNGPPTMNADGRYVAFQSFASNLVAGDTNGNWDIFVRDRVAGVTERVSVNSAGAQANSYTGHLNGPPPLSADGRYVVFQSLADNLVSGDTNGKWDVFVRDRMAGVTERVSVDSTGVQANGDSTGSSVSADGRYITFESAANNLVVGDANAVKDVFVRDRVAGVTTRVSVDSSGVEGNARSEYGQISADGRFIAYMSLSTNLVPGDTNNAQDIFVHDRVTGVTGRASLERGGGEPNNASGSSSISGVGRYVAFTSFANNLVPSDTNNSWDVFVRDRCIPPPPDTDSDGFVDCPKLDHHGPGNTDVGLDSCEFIANPAQLNSDGNHIDQTPPSTQDDKTWPNSDAAGDACDPDDDNDGLTDADEATGAACSGIITNPLLRDTDGDRILDGPECTRGSNPTSAASKPTQAQCGPNIDTDGDRLKDYTEVCAYNTNPAVTDSDGDQTLDGARDGCEAASINNDRVINSGDQLLMVLEIIRESVPSLRLVSMDVNKDGALNSGDQLMLAQFLAIGGLCP